MDDRIVLFKEKKDCCGCGACVSVCPQNAVCLKEDGEGFFYPRIDDNKCVRCGSCLRTCPIKKQDRLREEEQRRPHVKIINLHMTQNYGASIAAACLEDTVRRLVPQNYIVQTIRYENEYSFSAHPIKRLSENIRDSEGVGKYIRSLISPKPPVYTQERAAHFNAFHFQFLNRTQPMDNAALQRCADNDVALICGSDVIWHTKRIASRKAYAFGLNFGKDETTRIAFAPSIDSVDDKILRRKKRLYRKRLKRLDHVSVREADSVDFVRSAVRKDVTQCCDPAFLYTAEAYDEMIRRADCPPADDAYLYVYILDQNDHVAEYAKRFAKEKGLKIFYYAPNYSHAFSPQDVCCIADGPSEFLYRIRNAAYVMTTSYHCVVFSLLFQKPFLTFTRNSRSVKTPDLLRMFGLSDRLVRTNEEKNIDDPIDFDAVQQTISRMREHALAYLEHALSQATAPDGREG